MAVDIRRGACSRVACSAGHCDQRYARCDLYDDGDVLQGAFAFVYGLVGVNYARDYCRTVLQ